MPNYYWQQQVVALLTETNSILNTLVKGQEKIMTGLTDLQNADAALVAIVQQLLTDVQNALANDDPDAAVEAASVIVNQAVTDLQGLDTTVTGATTPPAGNPPATGTSQPGQGTA
jgi:hypothetical protein